MEPHRNYFDDCSNCFCNVFLSYLIKKEYQRGTLFAYLSLSNDNITDNFKKSILLMKIISIVSSIPTTLNEKETTKVGEVTPIAT